jgi:hypothetical protein
VILTTLSFSLKPSDDAGNFLRSSQQRLGQHHLDAAPPIFLLSEWSRLVEGISLSKEKLKNVPPNVC